MGIARPTEGNGGDLGADGEDTGGAIVFGEVFDEAEDGGAGEAALLVDHEALDGGAETEELGETVVGAGHVDAAAGAEDQVGDVGGGAAPFPDGVDGGLFSELWNFDHRNVLSGVQRRCFVCTDFWVLF